jgi:hypothetical protein
MGLTKTGEQLSVMVARTPVTSASFLHRVWQARGVRTCYKESGNTLLIRAHLPLELGDLSFDATRLGRDGAGM